MTRRPGEASGSARALDSEAASLVRLSAALAGGSLNQIREELEGAVAAVPAPKIEEALLQAYLFLGFPEVLVAMGVWREVCGHSPAADVEPGAEYETWSRRGEEVCRRVYGDSYEKLRRNVRRLHPELDRWMVEEGYGKVLGRPGLDQKTRELCIVSLLSGTGREPQLHSHLRGSLNVGATPEEVSEAVAIGLRSVRDEERRKMVRREWERVRARHRSVGDGSGESKA